MTNLVFVSDFFIDELQGGAEKCNEVFIQKISKSYNVKKIKTSNIDVSFLENHRDNVFIVANFFLLSEELKKHLHKFKYIIYEHDHKYVDTNNPCRYRDFKIPVENIINLDFYSSALAVLCQSSFHADILYKNTLLQNIINLAGNLWSDEDLEIIFRNIGNEKTIENAIMKNGNPNKGMLQTVSYCRGKNIDFEFIEPQAYGSFIENISKIKNLYFLPQWVETYNRVAIECRILGCTLISNNLIGSTKEKYYSLKGVELFDFIKSNNANVVNKIVNVIEGQNIEFFKSFEIPKLTFITSVYKGEQYMKNFLKNLTSLDLFETSELLIYDANSPEKEMEICKPFLDKYDNIKYTRLPENCSPTKVLNLGIQDSTGEFLTTAPVDDIRHKNYIRWLVRSLMDSEEEVCLVYGDCLQTRKSNETMERNSATSLYEHSKKQFSKKDMIKSLPGPMPVWKKSVHDKVGVFDLKYRYPADWEMWLRMIERGYSFKKINKIVGLYLFNDQGLTTSESTRSKKIKEEAEVFFKYKNIFGEENYKKYYKYFNHFRSLND